MKTFIKTLIKRLIKATRIHSVIKEIDEEINLRTINNSIINQGATFYSEASAINYTSNKNKIKVGEGTHVRGQLHVFKYGGEISVGQNCYIGDHSRIWSGEKVTIGNFVQISHNVNIIDTSAHEFDAIERAGRFLELINQGPWEDKGNVLTAPITIEDYAWVSFNVSILRGVTIGEGAIVGAASVVTKDVPPYTLVAGNPARIIKQLR